MRWETPRGGISIVDFNAGDLANNGSHNVTFKTSSTRNPKPLGHFTHDGTRVSDNVKSKGVEDFFVDWIPRGGGFDGELSLRNGFGSYLTGTVDIYVNKGFNEFFTLEEFDTLRDARLIMHKPDYLLAQGEGFEGIPVRLEPDEYLLVVGTANSGDGFGDFAFSAATSPVPEPASIMLLAAGAACLLRRRTTFQS